MKIRLLMAAMLLVLPQFAWTVPTTSVTWIQPTGTTSGTEVVEVWLRLTVTQLDAGPLYLDGTSAGFSTEDFASIAQRGLVSIDSVSNSGNVYCMEADTFLSIPPLKRCNDPTAAWHFQFNRGPNSFFTEQDVPIAPGESRDYLFATISPQNGPIAPGTYSLSTAELFLVVNGKYPDGSPGAHVFLLGGSCAAKTADCSFTRIVTDVPEPETYALMGIGLITTLAVARRRREREAT